MIAQRASRGAEFLALVKRRKHYATCPAAVSKSNGDRRAVDEDGDGARGADRDAGRLGRGAARRAFEVEKRPVAEVEAIFANLRAVFANPTAAKADVVAVLKDYLPNFQHIEKGKSLDNRM